MSSKTLISLEALQRTAEKYDPILRRLPAVMMEDFLRSCHFNLMQVDVEDRRVNLRRRGNLLRPYRGTVERTETSEILKAQESSLHVYPGFLAMVDNVKNYSSRGNLIQAGQPVNSNRGEHPYEYEIIQTMISTFIEDFTLAIPHAKHDAAGDSPLAIFDGVNTVIDALVSKGEISKNNGNLVESGPLEAPADGSDTKALGSLVEWLRGLHPILRAGQLDILITQETLLRVLDAFSNRRAYVGDASPERLAAYLRDFAALASTPNLITHPAFGKGDRIIACRPGSISVGINAPADSQFVQVRAPYNDPNLVQFWMQMDLGTRVDDWHAKLFAVNQGTIAPAAGLSGDYLLAE